MAYSENILARSIDPAVHDMLARMEELGLETAWDRYEAMQPQCGFGELGICCRNCNMGPCRISPFEEEGPKKGICGATADIIVARNLLRMIAAGAAAHSDHGRDIAHTLLLTAEGKGGGYEIKDEEKLKGLAAEYGIETEGRTKEEIALDLAKAVYAEFGKQEGPIQFTRRAPQKRVELWQKLGIDPRGIDREIVEIMHRTHIGVDNDYINPGPQGLHRRRLGRLDDCHGALRCALRHPQARQGDGQPGRPQGGRGQHHRPRSRAHPLGDDCGRRPGP